MPDNSFLPGHPGYDQKYQGDQQQMSKKFQQALLQIAVKNQDVERENAPEYYQIFIKRLEQVPAPEEYRFQIHFSFILILESSIDQLIASRSGWLDGLYIQEK
jgi:hypothetical protein